jgi:DNA-binding transcriptional LysR family regulator
MKLQHLRSLVAVYEAGSLQQATKRLHISQPALSRTLQSLEEELGVTLLVRSSQGVSLTPFGVRLIAHARHVLESVGRARRDIDEMKGVVAQSVSVGITTVSALSVSLEDALASFHARYPATRLCIHELGPLAIATMLREGTLDFAVSTHPAENWSGLETLEACRIATRLSVRQGHPLAGASDLGQLHDCLWVTPVAGPGTAFDQLFAQNGLLPPSRVFECSSLNLVLDAMVALDAVVLGPQLSPRMIQSFGHQVETLRIAQRPAERSVRLIALRRALLPSSAAALFDLVYASLQRQYAPVD